VINEERPSRLPYEGEDARATELWAALGEMPQESPGDHVRHRFSRALHDARREHVGERVRRWFGFSGNLGWATACACLLVGLLIGRGLGGPAHGETRLDALESNVAMLQRSLVLDRLNNAAPGKRLQGVLDAAYMVQDDPQITEALLARATVDRVASIRSAAIEALGPQLSSPAVGQQLMTLLAEAESPLVQYALIDLVLRHGSQAQLEQMLNLVRERQLHPDLERHINQSLGREST
jgi:hypothetical protein